MGYVGVLMKARECEPTGYMGERRGRVNYDIYSSFRKHITATPKPLIVLPTISHLVVFPGCV